MGVSPRTRLTLWTRSGGRCQFCNEPLLGDWLSGKDELNNGYVAHIVAESPGGPRGDPVRSPKLADDVNNLMLLCNAHHRMIDDKVTWRDFPEPLLKEIKAAHEARIDMVTGIMADRASRVLLYSARVGEHDCPARYDLAKVAVLPERFPDAREPIALDLPRYDFADHEPEYWEFQPVNLRRQFQRKVRDQLADGHIKHLSVFAIAPQPLLIELGRLLSDIPAVTVHQLHREPQGWDWRNSREPAVFETGWKDGFGKSVALILGLSATVTDDRIEAVLGDAPIWRITAPVPDRDIIHRREDLARFREIARRTLDQIKTVHGQDATIHIFPAMPVSAAVELGRIWMPKADLPLVIYDENRSRGGFEPRLTIGTVSSPASEARKELDHA